MKKYFFFFLLFPLFANAQETQNSATILTPEDAVNIALEKNFSIQAAKLQTDVANLQVFKGNAGMLPKIDGNAYIGGSETYIDQKLTSGTETSRFANTFAPNANVALAWTLFDGRKMFATYDKLKAQSQLSLLQTRVTMQTVVATVLNSYYQVILQKQTVRYLALMIKQYEEVNEITKNRWDFGKGSKIDYLQSQTDLNAQKIALNTAQNALKNAKIAVNQLLARDSQLDFEVVEAINITYDPKLDDLKEAVNTNNQNLQILRKNADINRLVEKEVQSLKLPRITLNSNYGYTLNKSNAGLFLLNQSTGLTAGVGLSWNIFNGQITRRQIQTAKINTQVIEKQQQDLQTQIDANLVQSYNQYQNDKQQVALEEENNKLAKENLTIALEKFKVGSSTILDIIQAQRTMDTSLNRLVNVRYNVKLDELTLLVLSGELVK